MASSWTAPLRPPPADGAGVTPTNLSPPSPAIAAGAGAGASSPAARLREYDAVISALILSRQDPVTGLLPASTAVTEHGDYRCARGGLAPALSVCDRG
jgi:hypothetical protein